jgi:SAM-dependent methyltransferase
MNFKAFLTLLQKGQFFLLLQITRLMTPFYQLGYIAALFEHGFFDLLAAEPASLKKLMDETGINAENESALHAWLQAGSRLKMLRLDDGQYQLNGLAKNLSNIPENDALLAIIQEIATLHHKLILHTPAKLKSGEKWALDDQDGEVVARSSRIVEPFQTAMIQSLFPKDVPIRLLEVGCGSGIYIKEAAMHNQRLTALGVELQEDVAGMARKNLKGWQLQGRVRIESGDVREKKYESEFDIVTLYNNIYYFPVPERVALLEHLKAFLKPGGFLILVTGCQGGQPLMEMLNLWGAATEGADRLPAANEMVAQMQAAGFERVQAKNFMPGDAFYRFVGYRKS